MTKKLLLAFALFSLSAAGCGKSVCEQAADQQEECGIEVPDGTVELCEAFLTDENEAEAQACIDCVDMAADSCTANAAGGPCDATCN